MPFDSQRVHDSPTGARLNLYIRHPQTASRGVVQINHGLSEHAGRYERFADFLALHGFHTYAHDHRGHGGTTAPDAPRGVFAKNDGAAKLMADVAAIHDLVAREHPGQPVIIFGHSMGGLIALDHVLRHPGTVRAAAIWNANFGTPALNRLAQALLAYERFRLGSDVPSHLLPRLTFQQWARRIADRRTEFDWLSRDAGEVGKYIADPLCGGLPSISLWQDVFRLMTHGLDDGNFETLQLDMPFSLVGGEHDPATDDGKSVIALASRMRRMGFSNLVSTIYPQTRHESLNELNRNLIMEEFAVWAKQAVAG